MQQKTKRTRPQLYAASSPPHIRVSAGQRGRLHADLQDVFQSYEFALPVDARRIDLVSDIPDDARLRAFLRNWRPA